MTGSLSPIAPSASSPASRRRSTAWSSVSWAAALPPAKGVARTLLAAGLAPGDRMGIWAPNCAEWLLVQYASAKAGVILVNINPAYRTSELAYALRQSGCRLLVSARAFKTSDYAAMVEEVA